MDLLLRLDPGGYRFLDEKLGQLHFWTTFVGFHTTFLIQHWLGTIGVPRRYPDYLPTEGFTVFNTISTIGAFVLGASTLPFIWNIIRSCGGDLAVPGRPPVGLLQLVGVGDQFTAAAAQFPAVAADPVRAAGVRAAPPVHDRPDAQRGTPRAGSPM